MQSKIIIYFAGFFIDERLIDGLSTVRDGQSTIRDGLPTIRDGLPTARD